MIDVIPLSACHTEQYGTISVTSLLSFNNYFDPRNAAFGSLLVFNDYRVPPAAGFKMHPHHNCEQLFFVVEGTQKCVDTMNNSLVLKPVTGQLRQLHAAFHERALSAPLPAHPSLSRNEDVFAFAHGGSSPQCRLRQG